MEDEQGNTIPKKKQDKKTSKHKKYRIVHVLYLLVFTVFSNILVFSRFVHGYFDSSTTPNRNFLFLEDVYYQSLNVNFRI